MRAGLDRLARIGFATLVVALAGSAVVTTRASPEHSSIAQRAAITQQLRQAIEDDPAVVKQTWFLKRASLVNFVLPVTIRLLPARDGYPHFLSNDVVGNYATLDLGESLGSRVLGLGGYVDAEVRFKDAFDSGQPGNVDLVILPEGPTVQATSLGLLTNPDTSTQPEGSGGCAGFKGDGTAADVDALDKMQASLDPAPNSVGPNWQWDPLGHTNEKDVVLRTGQLDLAIDADGEASVPAGNPSPDGSGNGVGGTVVGRSGGRANIFGLPVDGLADGNSVDVTVNLKTNVNTIAREVDDALPAPDGSPDPSGGNIGAYYDCRQVWTGYVTNHLQAIHLIGALHIAPALTADGRLRIAKVFLTSKEPSRQALAACLVPYALYASGNTSVGDSVFTSTNPWATNPIGPNLIDGLANSAHFNANLSLNPNAAASAPDVPCDSNDGPLNRSPFNVAATGDKDVGSLLRSGSVVGVSGDLTVQRLTGEVIIGHFPSPPSVAVAPVAGAQIVAGIRQTSGQAGVKGKTGCPTKPFDITVRGTSMATVVFTIDGKVVDRFPNVIGNAATIRVSPKRLKTGLHRVVARVTFRSGSGTKPKTLKLTFQRCSILSPPRFTG